MFGIKISKMKENNLVNAFDCGNASINMLMNESYYPTILQHAYSYLVYKDYKIIGAYMLKFMKIVLSDCPEEISDFQSNICEDCFSIHIKYIAIKKEQQGKGIGSVILKYIVKSVRILCEKWPIRLLTLEALKERYEWYCELGFLPFNEEDLLNDEPTIKMYLDCLLNVDLVNDYIDDYSKR